MSGCDYHRKNSCGDHDGNERSNRSPTRLLTMRVDDTNKGGNRRNKWRSTTTRIITMFVFFISLAILVVTLLKSMVLDEKRVLVNKGIWLIGRLIS